MCVVEGRGDFASPVAGGGWLSREEEEEKAVAGRTLLIRVCW
jgi:hypothetical protein